MDAARPAPHATTRGPSPSRVTLAARPPRFVTVVLTAVVLLSTRAESQQRPDLTPSTLIIETAAGARVFLDGTLIGVADAKGRLVLQNPTVGRRALKVSLEGRQTFEQTIPIVAGQTTRVPAALAELRGTLEVRTTPGADVQVDGKSVGGADAKGELSIPNLRPGKVRIRASRPGHASQEREIQIPAEEIVVVSIPLTPVATATASSDAPGSMAFKPNRTFAGHHAAIRTIVFSADGRRLGSETEHTLRVYEVPSGTEVRSCEIGRSDAKRDIVFDADGHLLVAFVDTSKQIRIVDCERPDTASRGFRPAERNVFNLSLSADGRRVAIGGYEKGSVWDARTGTQLSVLAPRVCESYVNSCNLKVDFGSTGSVAVAANGGLVILAASDGRVIREFARATAGSKSPQYEQPLLSADGHWLAALRLDDGTFPPDYIQLWEVSSGRAGFTLGPFPTIERHADKTENHVYTEFEFSPNGQGLAALTVSLRFSGAMSVLRFYDLGTGNELSRHEVKGGVRSIAFSPDGQWFALGMADGTIKLWRR